MFKEIASKLIFKLGIYSPYQAMTSRLQTQFTSELKTSTPTQDNAVTFFSAVTNSIKKVKRLRSILGVQPLRYKTGSDRHINLQQYYLETQFLPEFADDLRGHCLEFEENRYASRFGKNSITKLEILNIEESKPQITPVELTSQLHDLPSDTFDCIICTYVLHAIFNLKPAVSELHRILKPGGVLLVAAPHVSIRDRQHEIWRFTAEGLQLLLEKDFGTESVTIRAYGNSLTAVGAVRGVIADEFTPTELNYHDLQFVPVVCARAIKQTSPRNDIATSIENSTTLSEPPFKAQSPPLKAGLRGFISQLVTPGIYSQLKSVYHFYRRLSLQLGAPIARTRLAIGLEPLSYIFGYDRGSDLMRHHLEKQFLPEFADDIRGHCLEFAENLYIDGFGGDRVTKADVLHIDNTNPRATLVADLTQPNNLPSNTFDCIICTYVLHIIFDVEKAISELHRLLKPGGVLLVSVPQVSLRDYKYELWRFTPEGLKLLLERDFGTGSVTIRAYGNSLLAAAAIRGLVVDEFTSTELDYHDPRFAPVVCARAIKQS
jgi:SAM-dependent methyltransferase